MLGARRRFQLLLIVMFVGMTLVLTGSFAFARKPDPRPAPQRPRDANSPAESSLAKAFSHPVIIGASVSSGLMTTSPGERAALRYTSSASITNIARSGASARDYTDLTPSWAAQYSAILAVDFLYWDSTLTETGASVRALNQLIYSAVQANIPLLIGDIPQLRNDQVTTGELNAALRGVCQRARGCYIIPFARLHDVAVSEGLTINGRRYFFRDLTADGLHLNEVGSEYVAGLMINALQKTSKPTSHKPARRRKIQ